MDTETTSVETKVTTENVNLDEIFAGAPGADAITLPEEKKPNIFTLNENIDPSFLNEEPTATEEPTAVEEVETTEEPETTEIVEPVTTEEKQKADEVIDSLDASEEKVETRGRKKIEGISDVFNKLIKEDKIVRIVRPNFMPLKLKENIFCPVPGLPICLTPERTK